MNGMSNRADAIRHWWERLSPWQRRGLSIVFLGSLVATLAWIATSNRPARQRPATKQSAYELHSPDMAEEVLAEKIQSSLVAQGRQIADLQKQLEQMTKDKRTADAARSGQARQGRGTVQEDDLMENLAKVLPKTEIIPSSPTDLFTTLPAQQKGKEGQQDKKQERTTSASEKNTPAESSGNAARKGQNAEAAPPSRSLGVLSWTRQTPPIGEAALTGKTHKGEAEAAKPEPLSFYLPRPAFFDVRLLTGLDAPTGNKAKSAPSPIAFRVQDLAWLPNGVRQNVQGCLILAEGVGELSTERVNVRGISISCVGNDGQSVLDQTLLGYVADSDGKAGLRGQVVSKAGKLLAETMKVGFLQGLSEFFQFNARSVTVTDSGAVSSIPKSDDLGNSLMGGSFSGISKALEKVSDYYMDLAEEVFPVIQVSAARSATFVVTQGAKLVFDKTLVNNLEENVDGQL